MKRDMSRMAVRSKDIASMLSISPSSVSLALNNKPGVSDETRKLVKEKARELGRVSKIAETDTDVRNLIFLVYRKNGQNKEASQYFSQIFSEIIEGVESQSKELGYTLTVSYVDRSSIEAEAARLKKKKTAGILLLATEMSKEQVRLFTELPVPVVIIDNYFDDADADCVLMNNEQGVELAVSHLIDMGHERIGYIHVNDDANNFEERYFGFFKSMKKHGLEVRPTDVAEFSTSGGDALYWELKNHFADIKDYPTAFFADNDIIAILAIRVFHEAGYSIPEDISIIGFDDIALSELMDPPLTTIQTSKRAIGRDAVNALISKKRGMSDGTGKIELKTRLIERKSVRRLISLH